MQITNIHNPLSLKSDTMVQLESGDIMSPNQAIARLNLSFRRPVICTVNGQIWSRADWDCPVLVCGVIRFIEFPMGGGKNVQLLAQIAVASIAIGATIIGGPFAGMAASIAGSLLLSFLFPVTIPKTPGEPDTLYSVQGSNSLRINEPYAERFGCRKFTPDLAQASHGKYEGNEQYLYMLMIIGIGRYDVEGVYINNTPIGSYQDATYSVIEPGEPCPSGIVWPSREAGGQELTEEWLSFVVNPSGTKAYMIGYDIVFPNGLVWYDKKGNQKTVLVLIRSEVRTIDDAGVPTSDWVLFHLVEYRRSQNTAIRESFSKSSSLGTGRFEFRIRRVTPDSEAASTSDTVSIFGLRGYGGPHPAVQDVTLLRVRVKATNSLSGDVASMIRVKATRKLLPVLPTGLGTTFEKSRSIIDAVAYMVTSSNGGQQANSLLVWDELYSNKMMFTNERYFFDWGFTSRVSVMEAAGKAAACAMAVPYSPGGLFCLAVDRLQTAVNLKFSGADSIEKDSLKISHVFKTPDYPTCVRVTYTDPDTWEAKSVDCFTLGGSIENPKEIQLDGCTNRTQAYKIGLRMWKELFLTTTSVEFVTGLSGHIPTLFSWAYVGEDSVDWGQTGSIVKIVDGDVWTSEPVDFSGDNVGQIVLWLKNGSVAGPYACLPTLQSHVLKVNIPDDIQTLLDDNTGATSYIFGPQSEDFHVIRIMSISPNGADKIGIMGQVVNVDAYDLSSATPDPGGSIVDIDPLSTMTLTYDGLNEENSPSFSILWSGSSATCRVEIDSGNGVYVILYDNYVGFSVSFTTEYVSEISVRVTPYVDGVLSSTDAKISGYVFLPAPVVTTSIDSSTKVISSSWSTVEGADRYQVTLSHEGDARGSIETTSTGNSVAPIDIIDMGGPWPQVDIQVVAYFDGGKETLPGVDSVTIMVPLSVPTLNLTALVAGSHLTLSWPTVQDPNAAYWSTSVCYVVYEGQTANFVPGSAGTTKVYDGPSNTITLWPNLTAPYAHYYKIAAYSSVFGADPEYLNFSSSLTVAAGVVPFIPIAIPYMSLTALTATYLTLSWSVVQDTNSSLPAHYVIYMGNTPTFDPQTEGYKVYDGLANTITLWPALTVPYAYYYKISAYSEVFGQSGSYLLFGDSVEVKQD